MKTKKHTDRKTAIEQTIVELRKCSNNTAECHQGWLRLIRELEFMTEPEARMHRFKRLMNAIWIAATGDQT